MGFRIFDVQLCGSLDEDWLTAAVQSEGITPEELNWMISEGLLRRWTNPNGESGYLIYTPRQAEVLKKLKQSGRYGVEELRHIMSDWDDYLEAVIMQEPAYDDDSISDYEHFVRRAHEMLTLFEEDEQEERSAFIPVEHWEKQRAESLEKAQMWRRVCQIVDGKTEDQLSPRLRASFHRELLTTPSPERYAGLYRFYRLDELAAALAGLGPELWATPELSADGGLCPECQTSFQRTSPKRVYGSDRCQKRAKSRRWRERDPERARETQARYWKSAYPDLKDETVE